MKPTRTIKMRAMMLRKLNKTTTTKGTREKKNSYRNKRLEKNEASNKIYRDIDGAKVS